MTHAVCSLLIGGANFRALRFSKNPFKAREFVTVRHGVMLSEEEFVLFGDLLSQPCRAVALFMKAAKIPFIIKAPGAKKYPLASLSSDHSRINLLQLVPELDDKGFLLTECDAILKYLCSRCTVLDHWYPTDIRLRARVDEACAWCCANLHIPSCYIYIYQILDPKIKNVPVDRERLRRNKTELDRALDRLDARLCNSGVFLCGAEISIADIMTVCEVMQPMAAGHDVLGGRARVSEWYGRVKVRLEPHFDEVHRALHHTRDLRLRMIYQCSSFDVDY